MFYSIRLGRICIAITMFFCPRDGKHLEDELHVIHMSKRERKSP
jgi:hypothetical protein